MQYVWGMKNWNCKILGFHGCDYGEFRLLGYNTAVRSSQETYYVSATEPRLSIICEI
jgi:hypothetical protein